LGGALDGAGGVHVQRDGAVMTQTIAAVLGLMLGVSIGVPIGMVLVSMFMAAERDE
jgi:hypothetical protein